MEKLHPSHVSTWRILFSCSTQHRARRLGGAVHRSGRYALPGPIGTPSCSLASPPLPAFWPMSALLSVASQVPHRSVSVVAASGGLCVSLNLPPSLPSNQSPKKQTSPHTPTRIPLLTNTTPPPATFPREPKRTYPFLFLQYSVTQLLFLLFIFATLSRYVSS